jgi:hypothetical protein
MHVVNARVHAIWPPHSTGDIAARAVATVLCRCPLVSPLQLRGGRNAQCVYDSMPPAVVTE